MGDQFEERVRRQARQKTRKRGEGPWADLATSGLVGWSVAIPTLIGIAVGVWVDRRWPSDQSWTLMLLTGGVIVGCFNAWHWINRSYHD